MKPKVYLKECNDYNQETIDSSLDGLFQLLGGLEKIISPGDRVFLKINLVMKKTPEEAATTHPSVVEGVVRLIQKAGGIVTIGDSPGGPYTVNVLKSIYNATGMTKVAERTGCQLNYDITSRNVPFDGTVTKSLEIITPVLDFDKVIAVGKLKTHMLMTATMGVKLCFGYIPGLIKADYHLRMPGPKDFANLLVDIYEFRKPELTIIDAVYGMEGDGPTAGTPVKVGCLFAGADAHAIDLIGAKLMSIPPLSIPTIQSTVTRGLSSGNSEDIKVIGENAGQYVRKFKNSKIRRIDLYTSKLPKFVSKYLQPKPVFISELCKGCRDCERACPAKTITMINNKAVVDLDKCIRCYCCHELCPHKAISVRKPFISSLLNSEFKVKTLQYLSRLIRFK